MPDLGNDRRVAPGEVLQLSGENSVDPDGTIVSYKWNFGDGTEGVGQKVSHVWLDEGTFAVTLTVEDDGGKSASGAIRVTVSEGAENSQPLAVIGGPSRAMPGQLLSFSGMESSDPDGEIAEYRWDFGGAEQTGWIAQHAFDEVGQHPITLVVVDDRGAIGQASRTILISTEEGNQPPVAVVGNNQETDVGVPVLLDGGGSVDPDGTIISYQWNLGDGATANTPRAMHAYASPGTYTAELTVTDDEGAMASSSLTVTVAPPPSYDGAWILNPNTPSQLCDNTRRTYMINFPAAELQLFGTQSTNISATIPSTGQTMMGTIDRSVAPPMISLSWTGNESDPSCGSATIEHRLSAEMSAADRMTNGVFSVIYTWSDAFCTCARSFDVTGARR